MAETIAALYDDVKPSYICICIALLYMWTIQEEANRLAERFTAVKNRVQFARDFNVSGGGAMIYQHIKGIKPISLAAGEAYARGFGCSLREISPRLADEAERARQALSLSSDTAASLTLAYPDPKTTPAKTIGGDIQIRQFNAGGSMGTGVVLRDQPGVIQSWRVSPEWLQKNVKHHSGAENLCIVTGFGDSMRPMYNPGDPLLVDTGVKSVDFDAVYFFRVGEEGFIKRLQRIPGEGIRAISANKEYETWTIRPDMDFEVFGRVLKLWCSEDF